MSKVKRNPPKPPAAEKPSALEYSVADYMREHVPRKKTKFLHHPVEYFTASRAVDALLDSPWATGSEKQPAIFTDRASVVEFLDGLLRRKFFHRAKKMAISDRDLRRKQLKKLKKLEEEEKRRVAGRAGGDSEAEERRAEERRTEERSAAEDTGAERSAAEGDAPRKDGEEGKPKRRIKLDMHLEQLFVDGNDAYVWIYDPIPKHYWLLGALIVAAIVAVCLFPLWPSRMREYVYYLSLAAAGFLVVILALAVVRVIVFCLLWLVTWGRHQLWLLPNLTEDVGFFASFWPLYQYEYHGKTDSASSPKKSKKKKPEAAAEQKVKWEGSDDAAEKDGDKEDGDDVPDEEQAEHNDTREEEEEARIQANLKRVLRLLNLRCVPPGPPDSATFNINPEYIQILHSLMQNQTDSDSEDLLKRAQSFYPICDLPEDVSFLFRPHRDSMNIYFNLSSFLLTQSENVTIDMAELRLYRIARNKERRQQNEWEFGRRYNEVDSVRVSVYARSATMPDDERLVDSFLVPRYSQQEAVTFNVSSAFWTADDLNLLLRVTVEDVFGGTLPADAFFEQMDCSVVNESPPPRPLVRFLSKHNIQVKPHNLYPVLDLSSEEAADAPPLDAFVPSVEPCPEPAALMDAQAPRFYNGQNGFGDGLRMLHRRQRRRHHRRPHNRRHSGRRGQRHRGQH